MAESGVKCDCKVLDEFQKLSSKHQYRYIVFKLDDDLTKIVVEKTGDADKTFDDLKNDLQPVDGEKQCRYAVFDLKFFTKEQQQRDKVIFMSYVPDDLPISKRNEKMLYSSSKKALLNKVGSGAIHAKFHFGDHTDIDLEDITKEMRTKFK